MEWRFFIFIYFGHLLENLLFTKLLNYIWTQTKKKLQRSARAVFGV